MNFKMMLGVAAVASSVTVMASVASAESQLRGSMTAVSNVASAITEKSGYSSFKWSEGKRTAGQAVNTAAHAQNAGFKWAGRNEEAGRKTAAVDSQASSHRWILRNDADQSSHRWILRNDADQSSHRWILRNDAEQSSHRWILR